MEGLTKRQIIAPGGGAGLKLARGEHLRLIDIEGGQTGDLMAFSQDGSERLSNGRSFDYNGKIRLSVGDVLWSDCSNQMLTIVADDVGRHMSACPAGTCNDGPPRSLAFEAG